VPDGQATIVVAADNVHGRTTTIISFSTDPDARADYGPYTPGFRIVPYGDTEAMRAAIDETTVAVLIEPIQGEAGVIVPPPGYLTAIRELCTRENVLFLADEIQSGLGRTGDTFACDHEGVVPDMYVLGKALGGGVVPVSAGLAGRRAGSVAAGEHASTFGGNPLACAVGLAVVDLLGTGEFQERARGLGAVLHGRLRELIGRGVTAVRGRGLWAGVDIDPALMTGREACERLLATGVLARHTRPTIRFAPPLVVTGPTCTSPGPPGRRPQQLSQPTSRRPRLPNWPMRSRSPDRLPGGFHLDSVRALRSSASRRGVSVGAIDETPEAT
jgi:ornithine--oxo-acid transaminase